MNLVILLVMMVVGWAVRRSIAQRMERLMLERLPLDAHGTVEGAAGLVRRGSTGRAVLILHGFGDTPQTLQYLAEHLHALGFTVHAPLLPGHGRTLAEFGASDADAWLDAAARELAMLRDEFEFVGLVGVSMGGALAVILSADSTPSARGGAHPDANPRRDEGDPRGYPDALVLLAPYLSMRPRAQRLATLHWLMTPLARYLPSREEASIRDPAERARNRGFGVVTPRLLRELQRIVRRSQRVLPGVRQPVLVIQSRHDNRIEVAAAEQSFKRLGSSEKRLVWTAGGGHVITVDTGREQVLTLTGEWLLEHAEARVARSRDPMTG